METIDLTDGFDLKTIAQGWEKSLDRAFNRSCIAPFVRMIDLLLQLAYIAIVLAVISLFVCTLPVWLVVLLLR
jgi:hypothetical protein